LQTPFEEPSRITITGLSIDQTVQATSVAKKFVSVLAVPPGKHIIRFTAQGRVLNSPNDPRSIYFRILDPVVADLNNGVGWLELN
jgi:hypothetical protein